MARSTRLFKSFYRLLFPLSVLFLLSAGSAAIWLAHESAHPISNGYLVTPEKYGQLSSRGAQVTDEAWTNRDGTQARGWLLRGAENAPAVVLLHKYGADRSHVLNLGVKLNEATNFTVLMPDQRGHGQNPAVGYTSFGGCESQDVLSAIEFLRRQQTPAQAPLVGKEIGIYGLEMGSVAALGAASRDESVAAMVLDSVPQDSGTIVAAAIRKRFPFASVVTAKLGELGAYPYFYDGCYARTPVCDSARTIANRKSLLLAGIDAPELQDSTARLARCFPSSTRMEARTDLSPSGYSIINASLELSEAYDQRVIDFFKQSLGSPTMVAAN
jgi:pimeloyl-ACP methyl ester carboxylesterase